MKNIILKSILLLALIGATVISCTSLDDKFEDAVNIDDVSGGSSSLDPTAALSAVYTQLNSFGDQAGIYALLEHSSDEMVGPTRGTDWSDFGVWRQLHTHTWDPSHAYVLDAWNNLNRGVFRATEAISLLKDPVQLAEARFLRAFYIYYLVDLYGQVPFREKNDDLQSNPKVLSRTEATDFIIAELKAAIPGLSSLSTAGIGKASKEAAYTLLAKVYLNRPVFTATNPVGPYNFSPADMDQVIANCDAVTAANIVQLEPKGEYWDNFKADNATASKELIFTIDKIRGDNRAGVNNRYFMTLHYNQNPSGWNGFTTLADFYDKWTDNNDERKGRSLPGVTDKSGLRVGFLEGQQFDKDGKPLTDRGGNPLVFTKDVDLFYSNERQGIRVIKYPPDYERLDNPENNYVFLRYADVVLMKAEALFRKGDAAGALAIVNNLRTTRGTTALTALTADALLNERGFEFYWEGWRRNDQIRFGKFLNPSTAKPQASPENVVLYPIPQRAIDSNPNLKQNSGY